MPSVIINYCSNEKEFIDALLQQCSIFSNDIVVSYGSKLYDGSPEDITHILPYKEKYPDVQFVEYNVDLTLNLKEQRGVVNRPTAYWHNLARWTAIQALKKKEWVFVIDCDEIPEGKNVKEWIDAINLREECCYKMANYWYFKDPTNQATTLEDSVLLIHYSHLTENNIFGDFERDHLIPASKTKLIRQVKGLTGNPIWHHYSFVRSKKGLMHKIKNWAHSNDIFNNVNPLSFVNYIYRNDDVNDIVHGYIYRKVQNEFHIPASDL
jgi:hypothetical protein